MARSHLKSDTGIEIETVGRKYFEHLAAHSFFQDFEKGGNGNIIRCKMHDIVHDFTQFLTKNECLRMGVDNENEGIKDLSFQKGRHAFLFVRKSTHNFFSIYNMKTLLLDWRSIPISFEVVHNFFQHLTCL